MSKQGETIQYHSLQPVDKEGWLTKQGGSRKSWKRRWFVLKDSAVYYFKTKETGNALGTFSLRGAGVYTDSISRKEFAFSINTPSRTYILAADTDYARIQWMEACHVYASHGDAMNKYKLSPSDTPDVRFMVDGLTSPHARELVRTCLKACPGVIDVTITEKNVLVDVVGPDAEPEVLMDGLESYGFIPKLISRKGSS